MRNCRHGKNENGRSCMECVRDTFYEIQEQATRRRRGSTAPKLLLTDLEMIETCVEGALRRFSRIPPMPKKEAAS